MRSFLSCLAVLFTCATLAAASADDQTQRERDAKAALALAAAVKRTTVTAPLPREAGAPVSYPVGYERSISAQLPLVVFVNCKGHRVEGAVVCEVKGREFKDVPGPAVVVGYPQGKSLYIDSTMACPVAPAILKKAIDNASKKIDTPAGKDTKQAPVPKDWRVSAEDVAALLTLLVGGDCPGGTCAVASTPQTVGLTPLRSSVRRGFIARFFSRFRR